PILEANRGHSGISAEGRGSKVGQLPILLRDQANARTKVSHRTEHGERCSYVTAVQSILTAFLSEQRPDMPGALPGGRPGMPIGGNGPFLYRTLPVVCHSEPDLCAIRITVDFGDVSRCHQPGDLGRDRGRRIAGLLFPALDTERGAMTYDKVRR